MSNATDVLLLDGPKHGCLFCFPRPVPAEVPVWMGFDQDDALYETRVVTIEGVRYRVAVLMGSEFSDDTIMMHIVAFGHTPAWDLNPPYMQAPVPSA